MAKSAESVVGDLINFRGLVYAPLNENGVVFLFGKIAGDLNMYVEEIKPGFPDCVARRFIGKGWERVRVEFEFTSSNFKQHGHDPKECDLIVCWAHDWKDCPIEVLELQDRIKELDNPPIERPDQPLEDGVADIEGWFTKHDVKPNVRKLFEHLLEHVKSLDPKCFYKVGKGTVSVYSPERVFIYIDPRKKVLRLNLFTGGQPLGKVKQFDYEKAGTKWGSLSITSDAEMEKALPWIEESLKRIKAAVKNNEPTGWYAKMEEDDGEAQQEA